MSAAVENITIRVSTGNGWSTTHFAAPIGTIATVYGLKRDECRAEFFRSLGADVPDGNALVWSEDAEGGR